MTYTYVLYDGEFQFMDLAAYIYLYTLLYL